jgi:hypothetical protein
MLTCDQPVYLVDPFLDTDPELSIEEMARACLPHILEANSTDAFSLGGFCNGALLAWEIARQLERLGREVELVALIEAPSLNARTLLRTIAQLNGFIGAVAPRQLSRKFALDGMRAVWRKMGFPRYGPYTRAVVNYVPPKIMSPVICLITEDSRLKVEFSWRPWTKLARNVSCHYIAGTHFGCITKNVGDTARVLGRLIKQPKEIPSLRGWLAPKIQKLRAPLV